MSAKALKRLAGVPGPFFYGALVAVSFLTACASSPPVVKHDWNEERISILTDKIRAQEDKIKKLSGELDDYKSEKPKPPEIKRLVSAPVTAVATAEAPAASGENKIIEEEFEGDESDETAENENADRGVTVADSTHAGMHNYFQGLRLFESQDYEGALKEFRQFLSENPTHIYADRAEYFIAESHYRTQDYGLAVVATNRLESKHPFSFRLPEALLRRALAYESLGQPDDAQTVLREILKRYPGEAVAGEASRKLASIKTRTRKSEPPVAPLLLDD